MYKKMFGIAILLFLFSGCFLFNRTGPVEGMEFSISGMGATTREQTYNRPNNGKIALSKIWIPTADSFEGLKSASTASSDCVAYFDRSTSLENFEYYEVLTASAADPAIFDLSDATPLELSTLPAYETTYAGTLLDFVWVEFIFSDFSIRWYRQDSGNYHFGDVLVDNGSGWKYVYYKRVLKFDVNMTGSFQNNDVKVTNLQTPVISVFTSDSRTPSGMHYESWMFNGSQNQEDYVWKALSEYGLQGNYTDGNLYTGETLVQYFRLTSDISFSAAIDYNYIGTDFLASGPSGKWDSTSNLSPYTELLGGYEADALNNPKSFETFSEALNEAKFYKVELRNNMLVETPGINSGMESGSLTVNNWSDISSLNSFISFSPLSGGTEILVGFLDFNDVLQGEFSEEAGI